ncbi:MAG: hypothetical protein LBT00_00135 [Spirochaetaceae bacterium]|nr:hypothetical protein [Spirochaetaceae bacterium]
MVHRLRGLHGLRKRREIRVLSLRGAKRRSNPDEDSLHTGLLRSARNDRWPPAMTGEPLSLRGGGNIVAVSDEAIHAGGCLHPGLLRFARNDERQ